MKTLFEDKSKLPTGLRLSDEVADEEDRAAKPDDPGAKTEPLTIGSHVQTVQLRCIECGAEVTYTHEAGLNVPEFTMQHCWECDNVTAYMVLGKRRP